MGKIGQIVTPMNSHLVKFDKPKMGIIESYLEEVHGMLISDYSCADDKGRISFETVRTILVGEELTPSWHLDSFTDNYNIHFFKHYPELSMLDIRKAIESVNNVRGLGDMFDDLAEAGCYTQTKDQVFEAWFDEDAVCDGTEYSFNIPDIGFLHEKCKWIPTALCQLFSIQKFMKCRFHLKGNDQHKATIDMMNELLENHHQYGVKVATNKGDTECVNDGVYTYHINGLKEPQTRQAYMEKYPNAYDYDH